MQVICTTLDTYELDKVQIIELLLVIHHIITIIPTIQKVCDLFYCKFECVNKFNLFSDIDKLYTLVTVALVLIILLILAIVGYAGYKCHKWAKKNDIKPNNIISYFKVNLLYNY